MSTLEQQIGAALASDDVTSAELATLVAETEAAITRGPEAERANALDPIVSPDAVKAHAAMTDAAFMRERLRTILPRLQQRHQEVAAQEYLAQWQKNYEALKIKRDEFATELREYPDWVAKIVGLFTRIVANDAELSHLHQARPSGVSLHLLGAELVARNLENFNRANPSIVKELRLPVFDHSDRMVWPPQRTFDSAVFSPVSASRRYSADWGVAAEEEAHAVRDRQEREVAEQEAKDRANWRGPRWWAGERI